MGCTECGELIHAYLDGEFDAGRSLEMERHIASCPDCSASYEGVRQLRLSIAESSLYHTMPERARSRVLSTLRRAGLEEVRVPLWRRGWPYVWVPLAACVLVFLAAIPYLVRPSQADFMQQEIVSAHVRSLMPGHLTDVPSSDQHTVKPWFNGKLEFSPPVAIPEGFLLVGGRLDYVGNRPVAALIYQRRKHIISLFVWPSPETVQAGRKIYERQGYHIVHWTQSGMACWAVSDVSLADLEEFARLVRG